MQNTDNTNSSTVMPMAHQRLRIDHSKPPLNARPIRPGPLLWGLTLVLRVCTPITGANSTATIHDTSIATAMTAHRVKVYSPAEPAFRPMGTNPDTEIGSAHV